MLMKRSQGYKKPVDEVLATTVVAQPMPPGERADQEQGNIPNHK